MASTPELRRQHQELAAWAVRRGWHLTPFVPWYRELFRWRASSAPTLSGTVDRWSFAARIFPPDTSRTTVAVPYAPVGEVPDIRVRSSADRPLAIAGDDAAALDGAALEDLRGFQGVSLDPTPGRLVRRPELTLGVDGCAYDPERLELLIGVTVRFAESLFRASRITPA